MYLRQAVTGSAVVLLAGCLLGCSAGEDPAATAPTGSSSQTDSPGDDPEAAPHPSTPGTDPADGEQDGEQPTPIVVAPEISAAARESTQDMVSEVAAVLASPDGSEPDADVVTAAAAEAIRNQAIEYARNGWRVEGRSRVTRVEIYEHDDDLMVVGACVDNSALRVVGRDGNTVSDGSDQPPTLNIYTLERRGSGWVVVDHTFPDDPDC